MRGLVTERKAAPAGNGRRYRPGITSTATSLDSEQPALETKFGIGKPHLSRLLTVGEVTALLNVPRKWVYRRVRLKPPRNIPHLKLGKYLRFRESDLQDYVEGLRRN
jgi:excisionase family DNA binding protein